MSGPKPASGHTDNLPLVVGPIVVTVLALSPGDALIRLTSSRFVIWQIFVLRSLIAIPRPVAYLVLARPVGLRLPEGIGWIAVRSLMLVAMWVFCDLSLPELDLSAAAA